ncbi:hypothetical protein BW716_23320 [[Flexibacter] sp. ATCC 35208]|nr:hypothetical protein BW716_23320 [[Flexibacter] sp. ATCC 35208]
MNGPALEINKNAIASRKQDFTKGGKLISAISFKYAIANQKLNTTDNAENAIDTGPYPCIVKLMSIPKLATWFSQNW